MSEEIEQGAPEPEIEVAAPVEAPEPVETGDPELEAEAKKYGWRPKEQFDRAPENWVDAERFLDLPQTRLKMTRDLARNLERQVKEKEDRLNRIERTTQAALEAVRQQERQRYEAELRRIEQAKLEAVQTADIEKYRQLDAEEQRLAPPALPQPPAQPQVAPEVEAYRATEQGAWLADQELVTVGARLIDADPIARALPPRKQIEWAEKQLRTYYPERFKASDPEPQRAARVDAGTLVARPRIKGVAELPPEAKKIGADFVKQGLFKDLGEYAKAYHAQEN